MVFLTDEEHELLAGSQGEAAAFAARILLRMARVLGASALLPIQSSHIDSCLLHGASGVEFAERLVETGGRVCVPTTLNVGALDLLKPNRSRLSGVRRDLAHRLMAAYQKLGCRPTWTCAPYQVGHRPGVGEQVAWGESNAVAFVNSVLGARTNRYGDFLDICCALVGRAPAAGLHLDENRIATVHVDLAALTPSLRADDVFFPVLGSWLGRTVGSDVAALTGLPPSISEDQMKALGAAASSTGAVGLFHVVGVTPEAPDFETVFAGRTPQRRLTPTPHEIRAERDRLSTTGGDEVDAVALGSPHFSVHEFARFEALADGRSFAVPVYICTGRDTLQEIEGLGRAERLRRLGVEIVADTCVVVTPILPDTGGVLMTNSGKFAHYTLPNTGYHVLYGSLKDCVNSAVTARVERDDSVWQ